MTEHDGFIEGLLDETREEINRADTKASILLASAGVTVAMLTGAIAGGDIKFSGARGAVQLLAVAASIALGVGLGFLGAAVVPQLGKPAPGRARYFMEHAQYDRLDDLREALEREGCDPGGRHLAQLSTLSRIVRRKYRLTQIGELSGCIGVVLAVSAAVANQLV